MRNHDYARRPELTELEAQPQNSSLSNLSFIRKEITQAMDDVARIADRGASLALIGLGGGSLIVAFVLKLEILGIRVASLSAAEFISILVVSMILLLAGTAVRLLQFIKQEEAGKLVREAGVSLVSKTIDVGAKLATDDRNRDRAI
jgi:hypothetical protein